MSENQVVMNPFRFNVEKSNENHVVPYIGRQFLGIAMAKGATTFSLYNTWKMGMKEEAHKQ
jgi:hypothetical protein